MAEIILWNSIAKRRRSISDTFYDNGLGTLKGYVEDKGHKVEVIDWAQDDFFASLSPVFLTKWLRCLYSVLMSTENKLLKNVLGVISMQLQEVLSFIQDQRLKLHLRALAYSLKEKKTKIFGVKIWYGEAFKNAKYLVDQIKKISPETITIAGGYHVTLYEEELIRNSNFDLGVVCEGEFTLEKILDAMDVLSKGMAPDDTWNKARFLDEIAKLAVENKIENLIYRQGGVVFKTSHRHVAVHSLKCIPKYILNDNKVSIHVMVESLGCDWGKCNFCVHPHFFPHYALRDPEKIILEIEEMKKIGIGVFRFAGSDTPPAFGAKIAQQIIDKKFEVVFGMGSRAIRDAKDKQESLVGSYVALIKAGLRAVFMGGETGSDFVNQEVMNKGVFFEDIVYTIKALRDAEKIAGNKVFLSLAFIYPAPLLRKLTIEQLKAENIRLLKETMPDSVMITPPGPFLHTKWYEQLEKFGFEVEEGILKQAMEYEYVLYKPPEFWPKLGISLEGKPFKKLLNECNEFRIQVEKELEIPTDISDEHFLMFYCAGIRDKKDLLKIKRETMLDIVSCDYTATRELTRKINLYSRRARV